MKLMGIFFAGLVLGFVIGRSHEKQNYIPIAIEQQSRVQDHYASGWEVKSHGERMCFDPYVWTDLKEITCE